MMRSRRTYIVAVLLLVIASLTTWLVVDGRRGPVRTTGMVEGAGGIGLDATLLVPRSASRDQPAPAVLLAHGLGGDQGDVRLLARTLVRAGYVVRTWASRGTGDSEGEVGIAAADGEVADVSALIDDLAATPEVRRDAAGDPVVAVIGISQGGGVALLAAANDPRIDAVVPIFAWSSLVDALEPNGVLKLRWASTLFAAGTGAARSSGACGRLERDLCSAWNVSSQQGRFSDEAVRELDARSPKRVLDKIDAPTLIVQGQFDSLFDLEQAEQLAKGLTRARTTHRVEWVRAGHDLELDEDGRAHLDTVVLRWLERHLAGEDVETGPRFSIELGARRGHAHTPDMPAETSPRAVPLEADDSTDSTERTRIFNPPSGLPASVTSLPGLGDMTRTPLAAAAPASQRARFLSKPIGAGIEIVGAPRIRVEIWGSQPEATLFAHLVDMGPRGGVQVPRGLVAPMRVTDLPPLTSARGRIVTIDLAPIAWRLAPGHRVGFDVVTTDAAYAASVEPAQFAVRLARDAATVELPRVRTPLRTDATFDAAPAWQRSLGIAAVLLLLAATLALSLARARRRAHRHVHEPGLRTVPVVADRLTKRYRRTQRAVDGISFRVEPGSVVGLVGPNGAGKTTVIRMLLGLIRPSGGTAHLFGQRVRAGIPMLRRTGVLVEGPGLLTHRTGRQHLQRYASATGRPGSPADIDAVLEAVDLRGDADRRVGTWSHGMRQRLGIAQALLGDPEFVVLDEPTNGLDPAQIRHLRELIRGIAAEGRTVLISSHLLDELERTCTHVVLIAEGRVLAAGTLPEVVGGHADLEHAFLHLTTGGDDHA